MRLPRTVLTIVVSRSCARDTTIAIACEAGSSAPPDGGLGLALTIAHELAERLGGELHHEAALHGARLILDLPAS